jgi:hypothetical protein
MKKSKKAARVIGRVGRNPVIAVRVPPPLHHRITESAKASGRSMSEEMAALITRGFEWKDALRDQLAKIIAGRDETRRMDDGNLEAEMRRRGWAPLHGSPYWIPPEAAPPRGFVDPEAAPPSGFVNLEAAESELDEIDTAIKAIQAKLDKLKTSRLKKEA